jgi:periplasmic protein TonB
VSKEDSVPVPNPDDHISRLLIEPGNGAWFSSLYLSLKELISPPQLPPLELTSRPVQVRDMWGLYGYNKRAGLWSLVLHVSAIALAFALAATPVAQTVLRKTAILVAPDIPPYVSKAPRPGGGGDRSPLPASRGRLPKFASRQFTPPAAVVDNPDPKLSMEPTLVLPLDANVPNVDMAQYGDPQAPVGPSSNGQGSGSGIGNRGCCGGVGDGVGPGYSTGAERHGPPVYQAGGSVTRPVVIYHVEPDYSDEARRAKVEGVVTIYFEVNERGLPQNLRIFRPLGMGLDEKAIEAVLKWRFRPGYKDGKPVTVTSQIVITFRLL